MYLLAVAKLEQVDAVVPNAYAGLRELAWNRDPARAISAAKAYALYERNWRHLDGRVLSEAERHLVAELTRRFGNGSLLP